MPGSGQAVLSSPLPRRSGVLRAGGLRRHAGSTGLLARVSCGEGREQGEALPRSGRVHAPIVPANNGGDEQVLELMTQTQVQGAAGWLLKGSTVCAVATAPALPSLPG